MKQGASYRQLAIYYALLVLAVTIVTIVVVQAGEDEKAQPSIAGGYDVQAPNACLGATPKPPPGKQLPPEAPPAPKAAGPSFDVKQSGQFVNLSNIQGTLGGKLRLDEKLSPTTPFAHGRCRVRQMAGRSTFNGIGHARRQGHDRRPLGGDDMTADLSAIHPTPARQAARPRLDRRYLQAVAAVHLLRRQVRAHGQRLVVHALKAGEHDLGTLAYDKETGRSHTETSRCTKGGEAKAKAQAVDRNLNNLQLLPLDTAKPTGKTAPTASHVTTPSKLPQSGEKFTAAKQRESFGNFVASFFIAAAVVMLVARLFGTLAVKIAQPRVMGEVVAGITLGPDDPRRP